MLQLSSRFCPCALRSLSTPRTTTNVKHRNIRQAFQTSSMLSTNDTHQETSVREFQTSTLKRGIFENKNETAVTVWSNVKALKRSPVPALTLGLSGLIPFIAAPCYIISTGLYLPGIAFAQLAYGASILSFLGGVRWGFTIPEENPVQPDWVNLIYSVIPSLLAWTALIIPEPFGALTVIGGLSFAAYFDMAMFGYPAWFKGLRFVLSFVAVLSIWTVFMCRYLLPSEENNTKAKKETKTE